MSNELVRLFRVSRSFEGRSDAVAALTSISLVVERGQHLAIMGPSGSGKSTLLALMAGLDAPDSGEVTWPSFQTPLRPTRISVAYQTASLLPSLTIGENVGAPLLIAGEPQPHRPRIAQALASIGLAGFEDRYPDELSGGQGQRAALARAMVTNPRLLLADEPIGHLDQDTGKAVMATLFSWARTQDVTLVVATHDPAVVRRFDLIRQLDHGTLAKG